MAMNTENTDTCKDYFENHLSGDARILMLCLAPFTDVFHKGWRGFYADHLKAQPELAGLPFGQWDSEFEKAKRFGLIKPHDYFGGMGYLILGSGFSTFLKSRLDDTAMAIQKKAIESAYCNHYSEIGNQLARLIRADDSDTRQTGRALIGLENENLLTALRLGLSYTSDFYPAFDALSFLMIQRQNFSGLTKLCEWVMSQQSHYSADQLAGESGSAFFTVNDRLAGACLRNRDHGAAKAYYENGLALSEQSNDPHVKTMGKARTLAQLSRIAVEQEQWETATAHALEAAGLFNNNDEQSFMMVIDLLARIWDATKDDTIPETLGKLKGKSKEEVEGLLTRMNQPPDDEPA
jgi:hypothetical protein